MVKKVILIMTLFISSFLLMNQVVYAADDDVYEESYGLTNDNYEESDFLFNGEIAIYSDMYLSNGTYDEVTFMLDDAIEQISPQEGYEVQSITLKMQMAINYTEENVTILTPNTELIKEESIYGSYTATQYWLDIDVNDYQNMTHYTAQFSYQADSEPELTPRVGTTWLEVVYVRSLDQYLDVVDVDSDYSSLPDTKGEFLSVMAFEQYNSTTHSYTVTYSFEDVVYEFNVAIPDDMYYHVYSSPYDEVIYFRDIEANQMSIATSPEGETILYIQPDNTKSNIPSTLSSNEEPDIVGFATINLTTMEYKIINNLELMGVVQKEDNRYASLYAFFPTQIENLLSISVEYQYRINSILGIKGEWKDTLNTYVRGDQYDGIPPSWLWWLPGAGWGWASSTYITGELTGQSIYDIPDVIVPITAAEVPGEVEYKYVNDLGGEMSDLEELELYKITLGQFQDGFFTAFSDDNAYDIQELVIIEVIYEYEGTVYEASQDDIDSIVVTPDLSPGLFDTDDGLVRVVMVGVIGMLGIYLISALKLHKHPGLLLILFGVGVYILIDLGVF